MKENTYSKGDPNDGRELGLLDFVAPEAVYRRGDGLSETVHCGNYTEEVLGWRGIELQCKLGYAVSFHLCFYAMKLKIWLHTERLRVIN